MENKLETNVADDQDKPEILSLPQNEDKTKYKSKIKKIPFRLQENSNILTIHHTIKENEKILRIVICVACFDIRGWLLVALDSRGTIFVFDLSSKRYWKHMEAFPKPSAIKETKKPSQYVLGNKEGCLALFDVETSNFLHKSKISDDAIKEISFPGQPLEPRNIALICAGQSAILIDLENFTSTHRLDFDKMQMSLKFCSYLMQSENILTCFNNDTLHIWSGITLEVVRVVHPIRSRDKKLQAQAMGMESIPEFSLDNDNSIDGTTINLNLCDGLIAAYTYQNYGSLIAFSTWDGYVVFFSPYTFELVSMIRLRDFILQQITLMNKPNDSFIIGLTNKGLVVLLDYTNTEFKLVIEMGPARSMNSSVDCKYLAVCRATGELSVWSLCNLVTVLKSQKQCMNLLRNAFKQTKPIKVPIAETDRKFQEELGKLLTPQRLQQILQEFHCYPAKYRSLIWCSLLKLPNNKAQYQDLVQMQIPKVVQQRSRNIHMKNETLKRALIKCWSCLGQWCKVLVYNDVMPGLIFPFVKMFQQNPLITFEICATLILNQFQLFFEYHPLEPSNYLGLCENILQHYDKLLFDFFKAKDVTSSIYCWYLLKNSFSEILDEEQWMCLWDNILSAPVYFPIFVVVAYNIMQKEVLLRLPDKIVIEQFYHEQNPIDVRKLIDKARKLQDSCPHSLHPKRYMSTFESIPTNVYPKFLKYPNKCLDKYEEKVLDMQTINTAIDTRMRDLELEELVVLKRLENGLRQEEHTKRLKEVEKYYQDALRREEERINCQRKMLLLYQKEIRQRKGEVAAVLQEAKQRKNVVQKEHELHSLQYFIEQERMRNDINLMWAEEELQNQDMELLAQKSMKQTTTPPLYAKYREDMERLCQEQTLLIDDLKKLSKTHAISTTLPKIKTKSSQSNLDKIEKEFEKIQREFLSLTTNRKTC
ncbi:TBC1 domain family member 31 isoform X2 [Haematobia irritans]|uniref:TBC1 domain family member 31 isoform X2 n=1 Tax=Haematobia irritans TaxID=7368 RepID=UPI003F4F707E